MDEQEKGSGTREWSQQERAEERQRSMIMEQLDAKETQLDAKETQVDAKETQLDAKDT